MGHDQVRGGKVGVEVPGERIGESAADQLGDDEGRHRGRAMPAKVSLRVRPMVTAGLAKLVDEVNQ